MTRTGAAALLILLLVAACGGTTHPPVRTRLGAPAVAAALRAAGFAKFTIEETTDSRVLGTVFLSEPPAAASEVIVDIWALKVTAREAAARFPAAARTRRVCNVNVHLAPLRESPASPTPKERAAAVRFHAQAVRDEDAILAALRERCSG